MAWLEPEDVAAYLELEEVDQRLEDARSTLENQYALRVQNLRVGDGCIDEIPVLNKIICYI